MIKIFGCMSSSKGSNKLDVNFKVFGLGFDMFGLI